MSEGRERKVYMFVYTVDDIAGFIFVILLLVALVVYGFIRLIIWMVGGMFGGMMHRLWGYDPDAKEENNERADN